MAEKRPNETPGRYHPHHVDEGSAWPIDPEGVDLDLDLEDPSDAEMEAEEWRNGGPTRSPGMVTTTGGNAGPASIRRPARRDRPGAKVAPTTTGDATSGGMESPDRGSTSDASTGRLM